jgi:hypothetical protein
MGVQLFRLVLAVTVAISCSIRLPLQFGQETGPRSRSLMLNHKVET